MTVKIIYAPISDRMWYKNQIATFNKVTNQIRVGGNWFPLRKAGCSWNKMKKEKTVRLTQSDLKRLREMKYSFHCLICDEVYRTEDASQCVCDHCVEDAMREEGLIN